MDHPAFANGIVLAGLDAVALVALVAFLHDPAMQRFGHRRGGILLGACLGGVSLLQLLAPVEIAPGILVDLRNLPLALAAAFYGPRGALAALVPTVLVRLLIGGAGLATGIAGMTIAAAAGLAWAALDRRLRLPPLLAFCCLGFMTSLHLMAAALLPPTVLGKFLTTGAPVLVGLNIAGAIAAGIVLTQSRERAAVAATVRSWALCDPETALFNRDGLRHRLSAMRLARTLPGSHGAIDLHLSNLDHVERLCGPVGRRQILSRLGEEIPRLLRAGDLVARLASDRLTLVLPDVSAPQVEAIAESLVRSLAQPLDLPGYGSVRLRASTRTAWVPRSVDPGRALARLFEMEGTTEDGTGMHAARPGEVDSLFALSDRMMTRPAQSRNAA